MTTVTPGSYSESVPTRTDRRDRNVLHTFTESKLGVKTSEFYMMLIVVVGVLVAAYADSNDSFAREDGWRYASWVAVAYILSRGLAKLGTREPYDRDLS